LLRDRTTFARALARVGGEDDTCVEREVHMTNTIDYFELGSPDPARTGAFYGSLFDWPIGEPSMPAGYSMVDGGAGGLWDTSAMGGQNWAIFYVHVDDVAASVAKATELGASVAIPLVDNGTIEFAHLIDPLGNRFAVWKPKSS
jgi:hypothetical protein